MAKITQNMKIRIEVTMSLSFWNALKSRIAGKGMNEIYHAMANKILHQESNSEEPYWFELLDDNNNIVYEALSPYNNDGAAICWRVRQRLVNNQIEWYEDHDEELMGGRCTITYTTIEEAKADIAIAHKEIIDEIKTR